MSRKISEILFLLFLLLLAHMIAFSQVIGSSINYKQNKYGDSSRYMIKKYRSLKFGKIDSNLDKIDFGTHLEIYADFMSQVAYYGRNYGIKGYVFDPAISFHHKSGLIFTCYNYHFSSRPERLSQTDLTAGFNRFLTDKINLDFSYTYFWIHVKTKKITDKNDLKNNLGLSLSLYPDFINIILSENFMFGKALGYEQTIIVNKDFSVYKFLGAQKASLVPEISFYAGTNNVVQRYFSKKIINERRINANINNNFDILDYEFTLPVEYRTNHFQFTLAENYSVPENIAPGESTIKGSFFYTSFTIKFFVQ